MENTPLKRQAEEIIVTVDRDLQRIETQPADIQAQIDSRADTILQRLFNIVSDVDMQAAARRAQALKDKFPNESPEELAQRIIKEKCRQTGAIGAVTSGASVIPGIGTAAVLTLGTAADIGATFKLQAEMVLEIAALYDYPLNEEEKQRLVMVITGIGAGTTAMARRVGQEAAVKAGERFAGKSLLKAIPVVSVIASAGTNVLSTYVIGYRADAYFRLGPEAVGSWADSLRAISGVDERQIGSWLADSGRATGAAIATGAGKVGTVVQDGAKTAGSTAKRGGQAYLRWLATFWGGVLRRVSWLVGVIWGAISAVPKKISGLFDRRK